MIPGLANSDSSAKRLEQLVSLLQLESGERRRELERIREADPGAAGALEKMLADADTARDEGLLADEKDRRLPQALAPGTWVGPYQVERVLGRGGMGTVYLAYRRQPFERAVALKVMRPGLPEHLESRFRAERQFLASLVHPGIVHLHDGEDDANGSPYLVMEYVNGLHLDEYCRARGATVDERVRLVHAVAETLAFAHRRGVVHRDLKPSNILVGEDGRPRVTDFGLAKLATASVEGSSTTLTAIGLLLGTPAYMAPERLTLGPGRDEPGVDVYALGVILFLLLTDQMPFESGNPLDSYARAVREDAPPLRRLVASLPRDLETIVARALARDPGERFHDAGEMAEQLRRYLAGEPLGIRPPTVAERLARWAARHRRPLLVWGASFALVLAAMIGLQASWNRQLRRDRDALRGTMHSLWLASTRLLEGLPADEPAVVSFYEDLSQSFETARDQMLAVGDPAIDRQVAVMHRHLAESLVSRQKQTEALPLFDRSIALLRPLPSKTDDPVARAWTEFDLFRSLSQRSISLRVVKRFDDALADSNEAIGIIRGLAGRFPDEPARLEAEARHLLDRKEMLQRLGRTAEAGREHFEALDLAERSVRLAGDTVDVAKLNTLCLLQCQVAELVSDVAERERLLKGAYATAERIQGRPDDVWYTDNAYVNAMLGLGSFLLERGRPSEALPCFEKAIPAIDRLLAQWPDHQGYLSWRRDANEALERCRQAPDLAPTGSDL